jgi:hypothetical protein
MQLNELGDTTLHADFSFCEQNHAVSMVASNYGKLTI